MTRQEIEAGIALRYRHADHLRFALPAALCTDLAAASIRKALATVDGVWRVDVYPRNGKLSVRFHESMCSVRDIALALRAAVARAHESGLLEPAASAARAAPAAGRPRGQAASLGQRARELRARARLITEVLKSRIEADPVLRNIVNERTIKRFLNEVLAFYLIKVHWDLITKRWLVAPLRHRYEWLAVIYLTYLLVRSRRGSPANA